MPQLPEPENNYLISDPATKVTLTFWNLFAGSVGARLVDLEAQRIDYEVVIADLRTQGQLRIDAAITPLIEATQETLGEVETALGVLGQQQDELATRIDDLLDEPIPASAIEESAARVFVSQEQRGQLQNLAPATSDRNGLMSAADKVALDAWGTRISSLEASALTRGQIWGRIIAGGSI